MAEETFTGTLTGNGSGYDYGQFGLISVNGTMTMHLTENRNGRITGRYNYSATVEDSVSTGYYDTTQKGHGTISGRGTSLTLTNNDGIIAGGTATINGRTITYSATWQLDSGDIDFSGRAYGTVHGPRLKPGAVAAGAHVGAVKLSHAIASMGDGGGTPLANSGPINNTTDLATTLAPHH
jgi:hypothetical protein